MTQDFSPPLTNLDNSQLNSVATYIETCMVPAPPNQAVTDLNVHNFDMGILLVAKQMRRLVADREERGA